MESAGAQLHSKRAKKGVITGIIFCSWTANWNGFGDKAEPDEEEKKKKKKCYRLNQSHNLWRSDL